MNEINPLEPSIIHREFNAPQQRVFDAWTQVEHLTHWMFPMPGCTCEYLSANIVNGGSSQHKVTMPNGHKMFLFTQYEDIISPEKFVFLQYISNEKGEVVEMKHIPNWPKDMLATLLFEKIDDNRTKLNFIWEPRKPNPAEAECFEATRADHPKAWGAGMKQLDAYLKTLV